MLGLACDNGLILGAQLYAGSNQEPHSQLRFKASDNETKVAKEKINPESIGISNPPPLPKAISNRKALSPEVLSRKIENLSARTGGGFVRLVIPGCFGTRMTI
jgi:hypothetical protein